MVQQGLVGHWTFDEVKPIDSVDTVTTLSMPLLLDLVLWDVVQVLCSMDMTSSPSHNDMMSGSDFSTFWMYLYKDPKALNTHGEAVCPILRKGSAVKNSWILMNTHTGKVTVRLTTSSESAEAESLVSDALIRRKLGYMLHLYAKVLRQLFINGVVDKEKKYPWYFRW